MGAIASQITSLAIVYSAFYSGVDQGKHQSSASLAFVWGIHRDRWIPRTKGQLRGKCFHLMTSSWKLSIPASMRRNTDDAECKINKYIFAWACWCYHRAAYIKTLTYPSASLKLVSRETHQTSSHAVFLVVIHVVVQFHKLEAIWASSGIRAISCRYYIIQFHMTSSFFCNSLLTLVTEKHRTFALTVLALCTENQELSCVNFVVTGGTVGCHNDNPRC